MKTVHVRILVRVDVQPNGAVCYTAMGWDDAGEKILADEINNYVSNAGEITNTPSFAWVTAEIPVSVASVAGRVGSS